MVPVVLSSRAIREIASAATWYAARGPNLDLQFRDALDHALDLVSRMPDAGPVLRAGARVPVQQVFTQRFPYRIVYRRSTARVLVLAVLHTRRSPARFP